MVRPEANDDDDDDDGSSSSHKTSSDDTKKMSRGRVAAISTKRSRDRSAKSLRVASPSAARRIAGEEVILPPSDEASSEDVGESTRSQGAKPIERKRTLVQVDPTKNTRTRSSHTPRRVASPSSRKSEPKAQTQPTPAPPPPSQVTEPPKSQAEAEGRYHTRRNRGLFVAPLEPMASADVTILMRHSRIGTEVRVTWSHEGEDEIIITKGTVVADAPVCKVTYEGLAGSFFLPPPDSAQIIIYKVEKLTLAKFGLPNLIEKNREINEEPGMIIFSDGGTTHSTGESSAAIVCKRVDGGVTSAEEHAVFHRQSTNNVMELCGAVAALRYATRYPTRSIVVIVDSAMVYNFIVSHTTKVSAESAHLNPLVTQLRALYSQVAPTVVVARMLRKEGNDADKVVKECRLQATTIGDGTLFPDAPPIPPKKTKKKVTVPFGDETLAQQTSAPAVTIASLDDYIRLRKYPARSRVPPPLHLAWATLVKNYAQRVLQATTSDTRDSAMLEMLSLPTMYLPSVVSEMRLTTHMTTQRPFSLTSCDQQEGAKYRKTLTEAEKLDKHVERLVTDGKVTQAVKALQTRSGGQMMSDEEKLRLLGKKISSESEPPEEGRPKRHSTAPFTGSQVWEGLKKMARDGAQAIDGWSRDLLLVASIVDRSILDDFAIILTMINDGYFGTLVMNCLRAARLVAIPKEGSSPGVRPIAVSNFFVKLLGGVIVRRGKLRNGPYQYGTGGIGFSGQKMVHQVREAYERGLTVIRFDSENAFNCVSRNSIYSRITNADAQNYFGTFYEGSSDMVVYSRNGHDILKLGKGVRQGDCLSSYLFCLAMDAVLEEVVASVPDAKVWCYIDDLTMAVPPHLVSLMVPLVAAAAAKQGMRVNEAKTQAAAAPNPITLLGACIGPHEEFRRAYIDRQQAFGTALESTNIHPQAKWTLLRLCGSPRLIHYCSLHPPSDSFEVAKHFTAMTVRIATDIVGAPIGAMAHEILGGGLPDYPAIASKLYEESLVRSRGGAKAEVSLVPNTLLLATHRAQHNATWMFWKGGRGALTNREFRTAMQIRMRTFPAQFTTVPSTCDCGHFFTGDADEITHGLSCPRYSEYTATHRHNEVRNALRDTACKYGFDCVLEPNDYVYTDGSYSRPDIRFNLRDGGHLVTDVTIVATGSEVGVRAANAASEKVHHHREAVEKAGGIFIPFAMEVWGHCDPSCAQLTEALSERLSPHLRYSFKQDMEHSTATALARAWAHTFFGRKKGRPSA